MKPLLIAAFITLLILSVVFVYHARILNKRRQARERCLNLTRYIRSCGNKKEWDWWRSEVSNFLEGCHKTFSVQEYQEYKDHLESVLSDKLAFFMHQK